MDNRRIGGIDRDFGIGNRLFLFVHDSNQNRPDRLEHNAEQLVRLEFPLREECGTGSVLITDQHGGQLFRRCGDFQLEEPAGASLRFKQPVAKIGECANVSPDDCVALLVRDLTANPPREVFFRLRSVIAGRMDRRRKSRGGGEDQRKENGLFDSRTHRSTPNRFARSSTQGGSVADAGIDRSGQQLVDRSTPVAQRKRATVR